MAKDKPNVGGATAGGVGMGPEDGASDPAPVPESPRMPRDRPGATDGGTTSPPHDEPAGARVASRKPRQSQPVELAQLVQSEETRRRIAESLPRHLTPERWISVLLNVNSGTPELQRCDPRTIVRAALQGAVLGLDFNKTLKEAYLIPRSYEKAGPDGRPLRDDTGKIITFYEATFMPGYAGLRKLVMNGGDVTNVRSALVYESEIVGLDGMFVYEFDPDLRFVHRPCLNPGMRGGLSLAYAVAKLKSGEHVIEVMTIDEVEKSGHQRSAIYQASRRPGGKEYGPWVSDYEMMVRKTVLKRLCGQLPMSAEAARAIELDNQGYVSSLGADGPARGSRAIEVSRRGRGSQTLADRLGDLDGGGDGDSEDPGQPLDAVATTTDTETVEAT